MKEKSVRKCIESGESDQSDDIHSWIDHHCTHKGDHWNVKCPQNDSRKIIFFWNTNLSHRYLMPGTEYNNVDGTGLELFKNSHKARLREKKI